MEKEDLIVTVLGGLRPIALLCKNHNDVLILKEVVDSWSDVIVRASEEKELAATDSQQRKAKIAAIIQEVEANYANDDHVGHGWLLTQLRQLSAIA